MKAPPPTRLAWWRSLDLADGSVGAGDHWHEVGADVFACLVEVFEFDPGVRRDDEGQGEAGLEFGDGAQVALLLWRGRGVAVEVGASRFALCSVAKSMRRLPR